MFLWNKQVLLNLVSNAIKYNRLGGKVWIEWSVNENDKIHIEIRDTGIGLMISKRLVELMDGEIGFASSKEEGTTFWVDLSQADKNRNTNTVPSDNLHALYNNFLPKFTLLYIEDNKNNLELIKQFIQKLVMQIYYMLHP